MTSTEKRVMDKILEVVCIAKAKGHGPPFKHCRPCFFFHRI